MHDVLVFGGGLLVGVIATIIVLIIGSRNIGPFF